MFVLTTKNQIFRTIPIFVALLIAVLFTQGVTAAADKVSLGKVYVEAALDDDGFPVPGREDSAGDLQTRVKSDKEFDLVYEEDDADFKMVVLSRFQTGPSTRIVQMALYVRDGDGWKPGIKVSNNSSYWSLSAEKCSNEAKKWIKNQAKNR